MPVLCKPAVAVPEHIVTLEQTLDLCRDIHAKHPRLSVALRMLQNTGVKKRHFIQPIETVLTHPGFEARNKIYEEQSKLRTPSVVREAIRNAELEIKDIDVIIYVSSTGFMMPSMTSFLINAMGFRADTKQIPIAQLGCAGGGSAINRAFEFCKAYPNSNALIVACEFCSLCYQPDDVGLGNLLSNGLFGDGIAAAVVRGKGGVGPNLERNASYLIPNTEDWISYSVRSTGFHFMLDKRVPGTMEPIAPALRKLTEENGWDVAALDFYIIHAGGPRILDDLSYHLKVHPKKFAYSRATLTEYGNIASAVVLDALKRAFDDGVMFDGAKGMIAGFGPGITAEVCIGTWVERAPEVPAREKLRQLESAYA
jgi:1,3,6,8-tetrahydroxynaphthalene synthase